MRTLTKFFLFPSLPLLRAAFFGALLLLHGAAHAQASAPEAAADSADSADPVAAYKEVDLKTLVAGARSEIPGQRIILVPTGVRFSAVLAAMPAPQKTDYLKKALGMMGIDNFGKVSQRIGLDYGGEKALAAYIEDSAAARLGQEAKPGQSLQFFAYHVYNHARGPALVVVSFTPPPVRP
ncbi:MAG: hypothetical protein LBI59_08030 [Candidatus Accumulibacter sp.]|jgi:hypothetical protein|nr:hypothetical protein [Accumulibacter sp.]